MMARPEPVPTAIPGLLLLEVPLHQDSRGWFKENWNRQRLISAGLDFDPVQLNVSFNAARGVTRGLHAEPWDKYVSLATGRAWGAWVDLRPGDTFGRVVTAELTPARAVFVPRGVANGFQVLEDDTAYVYLVNGYWNAREDYVFVSAGDPQLGIPWPVPLSQAVMSDADRAHPLLAEITSVAPRRIAVVGAGGQLGRALAATRGTQTVDFFTHAELDITDATAVDDLPWWEYHAIVNAAAWTDVEGAETAPGRAAAWAANATGVANLARAATAHGLTLVQVSSDYVFDGARGVHREEEPVAPLSVYGQTKAAGEAVAQTVPHHYVVRTSWLVGDGHNFVRTMMRLAREGAKPRVIFDRVGRLTVADELARAIWHLLQVDAPAGIYHVSNSGPPMSWADVAEEVFEACGRKRTDIVRIRSAEYGGAPRPASSVLALDRITATGFRPGDQRAALQRYLAASC